jgi:hypothetical protein
MLVDKNRSLDKRQLGQRDLKSTGYSHIESSKCPSRLIVRNKDNMISVLYYKNHFGHELNQSHIRISKQLEKNVATMLVNQIDNQYIIESNSKLSNKDLDNIVNKYGINFENKYHTNDLISVNLWAEDFKKRNHHILCFKKFNEISQEYLDMDKDDFFVGFMTNFQLDLVKNFKKEFIIQIDSTHNLCKQGFKFTSIHIKDELHETFPISFLFSNKEDKKTILYFLNGLRKLFDQNNIKMNAKVIMTDDYSTYYTAWTEVFYEFKPIKLLCSWYVIRSIRKNMKKYIDKNNQNKVMKAFLILRNTLNDKLFEVELENFLNLIKEFPAFLNYFTTYYLNRKKEWAYCYRKHLKINVNMGQENYHLNLKRKFNRKKTLRLDKSIFLVLKNLQTKINNRDKYLSEGKKSKRTTTSFKNHKKAVLSLNDYIISKDGDNFISIKKLNSSNNSNDIDKLDNETTDQKENSDSDEEADENDKTEEESKSHELNTDNKFEDEEEGFNNLLNNSEQDEEKYLVCIQKGACTTVKCPLKCLFCDVCLCEVFCTCKDFCLDYNFCIHQHIAILHLKCNQEKKRRNRL